MMHRIFKWHEQLDCFVIDPDYKRLADYLGLTEWHETVWIGRFFTLDNDYGEHWFDNWPEREARSEKAEALGLDQTELFVLDPDRFKNDKDGPCHSPEERVLFWKDVLVSLQLSSETLFREARKLNEEYRQINEEHGQLIMDEFLPDLEARINAVMNGQLP